MNFKLILLAALTLFAPQASQAARTYEAERNGGARIALGSNDIFEGLGKQYQLQFLVPKLTEEIFDIGFSTGGVRDGIFEENIKLKLYAIDNKIDLWSTEFEVEATIRAVDKVTIKNIIITHIIDPHPGEPKNNIIKVRDLTISADGLPTLPDLHAPFTGDEVKGIFVAHGPNHIDGIESARLSGLTIGGRNFTGWQVRFQAVHSVPGLPGPLPALGLPVFFGFSRQLRKRIKTSSSTNSSIAGA